MADLGNQHGERLAAGPMLHIIVAEDEEIISMMQNGKLMFLLRTFSAPPKVQYTAPVPVPRCGS